MLIGITGILAYLSFQIIRPFLTPIAWAIVMTVVFYPLYAYITRFIRWKGLASGLTLVVVALIIIGPFTYLLVNLAVEIRDFLHYLNTKGIPQIDGWMKTERVILLQERLKEALNLKELDLSSMVSTAVTRLGRSVLSNVTTGVANVASVVINFVFMLFAMFFMLKDGPGFVARIGDYLPFSDRQKDRLATQMKDMVISTIYGGVVVSVIQGILGGITFLLLGLGAPVLLGTATAIMSFIPALGAFGVWGPVLVYLIVKKLYLKAIILFFVGTFIISMVDNFLKPVIISGRTRMPTLLIFFSVLGGLRFFGLIGLVLGPLVIAMFISVIEIFRNLEGGRYGKP